MQKINQLGLCGTTKRFELLAWVVNTEKTLFSIELVAYLMKKYVLQESSVRYSHSKEGKNVCVGERYGVDMSGKEDENWTTTRGTSDRRVMKYISK